MHNYTPRLRNVNKTQPAFKLNEFPARFPYKIGEQIVYILGTRGATDIEGKEWELIFANSIGADWKPSNVGLDDIVLGNTAWGAKSVKHKKPSTLKSVRLISGRNDLLFSYGYEAKPGHEPNKTGELVLNIYNDRVSNVRQIYKHVRTVVLIRSLDLTESVVFEFETIRYEPELYYWEWNKRNNLLGYSKKDNMHKFTWQPGGTQFTIIERVPYEKLRIFVKRPGLVSKDLILNEIGYDESWVTVSRNNGG